MNGDHACPVCAGPVARGWQGRPPVYCGKRCRQAAYRARLAAEYAARLRGQLAGCGAELAEAAADVTSVLGNLPAADRDGVPGWWTGDASAYADRTRRLASRVCDLTAAYRRAAAEFDAARAVFGRI
jgi:endogenous inhibitor of DNA gyrase (YacG/DUF329 family)